VPAHTIVLPSGHTVAVPDVHATTQPPASQITLHAPAPSQSTVQLPVHSSVQLFAWLQSTLDPAPTIALHGPFSLLQSSLQLAPQFALHDAAELQSIVQSSRHKPTHDCVSLLQSILQGTAVPQSTEHGWLLSHWQLAPLHVPELVVGDALFDGGGAAPIGDPGPPVPEPELPHAQTRAIETKTEETRDRNDMIIAIARKPRARKAARSVSTLGPSPPRVRTRGTGKTVPGHSRAIRSCR
jgi:hypothetical protein